MPTDRPIRSACGCDGFTLTEMSVVLIIVGLIVGTVFPALIAMREQAQQSKTAENFSVLMRASAAFVHANGCLPCPTPAGKYGSGFGFVRGVAPGEPCGDCAVAEGIVPFASLGLPMQMSKDGWGRWITMRIDPALAINFGVVPPTAPCTASDSQPCVLGASQKGLCQANIPPGGRISVSLVGSNEPQRAAILFLSHGPNGYGAYKADSKNIGQTNNHIYNGPSGACTANGGFERCNADGNAAFTNASHGSDYDDVMTYMDRNALVGLIGNSVCQTAW